MGLILGVCRTGSVLAQRTTSEGPRWTRAIEPALHTPISPFENIWGMRMCSPAADRVSTRSGRAGENVARNGSRPGHPSQSIRGERKENKNR